MSASGKKLNQNYIEIIKALDPRQPYCVVEIVDFAVEKGLLPSRSGGDFIKDKSRARRTFINYSHLLDKAELISPTVRGIKWCSWLGYHWKLRLQSLSPEELLELEEIRQSLALSRVEEKISQERSMNKKRRKIDALKRRIGRLTDRQNPSIKLFNLKYTWDNGTSNIRRRINSWLQGGKAVLFAVLATVCLSLTAAGIMLADDPFQILRSYGLAAAKQKLPIVPSNPDEVYKQSWIDYLDGKYDRATNGLYGILADRAVSGNLRGKCHYLLGAIQCHSGQYQKATGCFLDAYDVFSNSQDNPNQFLVAVEIANTFAATDRYDETELWLSNAWGHYQNDQVSDKKIKDLGQFFLVKLDLAAARGNYHEALSFAQTSLQEAEKVGNQGLLPYTFRQAGFWYGVNGCAELARYYTDLASAAVLGTGDERPTVFILVNRLLMQRIDGNQVNTRLVNAVRAWAKARQDTRLEQALDQALSITLQEHGFDCDSLPIDH